MNYMLHKINDGLGCELEPKPAALLCLCRVYQSEYKSIKLETGNMIKID